METKYSSLFEPFTFSCGAEATNRMVIAPMTHFSSNEEGKVTQEELAHYKRRSKGFGMVITGCAYIAASGIGFPGEPAADKDDSVPSLKKLAKAIKKNGTKAILQINHGGRRCPVDMVPDGDVVGPSAIAYERPDRMEISPVPRTLEQKEIEKLIWEFGQAVRRAIEAGFDGVELHGANGYLLQQFFSPHSNRREDEWGGDIKKRTAFPLAVIKEAERIREKYAFEPFILGYRFSPEEPETPGITMDQTLLFVEEMLRTDLDYLHVSLGDFWSNPRRGANGKSEWSRLEILSEAIKEQKPLIGVGSIFHPEDALNALKTGVQFAALGRAAIIEPDWAIKVADGSETTIMKDLDTTKKAELAIPEALWKEITTTPGWFPIKSTQTNQ